MLISFWSAKGGSGTSVVAAASAIAAAKSSKVLVADLAGDQAAIFGLPTDPELGLLQWLEAGPEAPVDALEQFTHPVASIDLLPMGVGSLSKCVPEAGAALGMALRDLADVVVVDAGRPITPTAKAMCETADFSIAVGRCCYLGLRHLLRTSLLESSRGVVLIDEPGRALSPRAIADSLQKPVLGVIPATADTARCVDAGLSEARLPRSCVAPLDRMLQRLKVSV